MRTLAHALLLVLAIPTLAAAQSVAGLWRGDNNGIPVELSLKVEGESLTGTLTRGAESYPINEGTAVKTQIRFKITRRTEAGADFVETIIGELKGEQLVCYLERQGPESSIAFARVK